MDRLWGASNIVSELRELLQALRETAPHLTVDPDLDSEVPLRLHSRYTRNEILAAFAEATPGNTTQWREGVRWIKRYKTDVFLVTLNKSERRFSPTTRYRDYPISPSLFHWESQSTTSAGSPTGHRYINHRRMDSQILLFVRESLGGDTVGVSPFLFLGKAVYVRHEKERPIAITWRLEHEMPPDFFQAAKAAV
jgi:hypothetical protein